MTVVTELGNLIPFGFSQHHVSLISGLVVAFKQRPLPTLYQMENFLSLRGAWVARD